MGEKVRSVGYGHHIESHGEKVEEFKDQAHDIYEREEKRFDRKGEYNPNWRQGERDIYGMDQERGGHVRQKEKSSEKIKDKDKLGELVDSHQGSPSPL